MSSDPGLIASAERGELHNSYWAEVRDAHSGSDLLPQSPIEDGYGVPQGEDDEDYHAPHTSWWDTVIVLVIGVIVVLVLLGWLGIVQLPR